MAGLTVSAEHNGGDNWALHRQSRIELSWTVICITAVKAVNINTVYTPVGPEIGLPLQ